MWYTGLMVDTKKKSPSRVYTLQEVQELRLIPWAHNPRTIRILIANDRKGANYLQVKIKGAGKLRRYFLPHSGITKYLKIYAPSHTSRKHYGRKGKGHSGRDTKKNR